jgi:lipopolysaccharide/colanic/teichoic acid biosynthesis glycosyltransferase
MVQPLWGGGDLLPAASRFQAIQGVCCVRPRFEVSRGAARQKPSVFSYARSGKRTFDIVAALLLLLAFLPLIVLLASAVAFDGSRPFFGHARVGRGGRMFSCWKLRSMVPDAEDRLRQILLTDPQAAAEWARDRKLRSDPRISPVGDILRRTSLDELPQLWNVLRGDMSLVAPAPSPATSWSATARPCRSTCRCARA